MKLTNKQSADSKVNSRDLQSQFRELTKKLAPHFGSVFYIVLLLGVTTTVFMVGQRLGLSGYSSGEVVETPTDTSYSTSFDAVTIKKLRDLSESSNKQANMSFPGGRINPFAE